MGLLEAPPVEMGVAGWPGEETPGVTGVRGAFGPAEVKGCWGRYGVVLAGLFDTGVGFGGGAWPGAGSGFAGGASGVVVVGLLAGGAMGSAGEVVAAG